MAVKTLVDDEHFSNTSPNPTYTAAQTIVESDAANNVVTNDAVLWSTNATTVEFLTHSSNAQITNEGNGFIRGAQDAIDFLGTNATIDNAGELVAGEVAVHVEAFTSNSSVTVTNRFGGTIKGTDGIDFVSRGESHIDNDGTVYGQNFGISLGSATKQTLINSGEIGGGSAGISYDSSCTITNRDFGNIWSSAVAVRGIAGTATITNKVGCQITGTQAAITTFATARIALTNLGKIAGLIDCNAADRSDSIVNKGTITGLVHLGGGADNFNGAGGGLVKVFGEAGADTLIGGANNDSLDGGAGIDHLTGGLGKDILTGGTERDIFDFNSIAESRVGANRDVITHFDHGDNTHGDDIDLTTIDAKRSTAHNDPFHFISTHAFHHVQGELRYIDQGAQCIVQGDVNGDAHADFEILVKTAALSAGDFLL
jgi:Ca2+-binding RTX toxin-like protein